MFKSEESSSVLSCHLHPPHHLGEADHSTYLVNADPYQIFHTRPVFLTAFSSLCCQLSTAIPISLTMNAENSFAGSILADLGISRPKSQIIGDGTIPLRRTSERA